MDTIQEQTLSTIIRKIEHRLAPKFGTGEARAMTRIIFENLKGWSPVDMAIRSSELISAFICEKIGNIVNRLLADEPIQYIFGNTQFFGLKFTVTPATLIPRPETEELVDIIIKENKRKDLRVLDIGTGSGCIAITLYRNLLFPQVNAIDISQDAIDIAKENSNSLRANVRFIREDILTAIPEQSSYDIIVSNPPYITEHEKNGMEKNVLDFEPSNALFVPDSDPLLFYHAILDYSVTALSDHGKIYFEINPLFASNLCDLAAAKGFSGIEIMRDLDRKKRFFKAELCKNDR